MSRHIGGDDFQHCIDREQEAHSIDAWRARQFDTHRLRDMIARPWLYDCDPREWSAECDHAGEFGLDDR